MHLSLNVDCIILLIVYQNVIEEDFNLNHDLKDEDVLEIIGLLQLNLLIKNQNIFVKMLVEVSTNLVVLLLLLQEVVVNLVL